MFGALISATDPVAIIAMFKDNKIHGRLRLLVESESLFNDGAAAVLFSLALTWAQAGGHAPSNAMDTPVTLVRMVVGGDRRRRGLPAARPSCSRAEHRSIWSSSP